MQRSVQKRFIQLFPIKVFSGTVDMQIQNLLNRTPDDEVPLKISESAEIVCNKFIQIYYNANMSSNFSRIVERCYIC